MAAYGKPEFQPSFGRRLGHRLNPHQSDLINTLLPKMQIVMPAAGSTLSLESLFPNATDYRLELGFGGGEHLYGQAVAAPQTGFIGGEPFLNGVASLLSKLERRPLPNIRIVPDDIRPVMRALPDGSLKQIDVLYPDPWPKQRHWKRRIIALPFLREAHRLLKLGGTLFLATDHVDYSVWMFEQFLSATDLFEWQAQSVSDWHRPPEGWIPTRYEQKTKTQGREPVYLTLIRK